VEQVRLQEAGRIAGALERKDADYRLMVSVYKPKMAHGQKLAALMAYFDAYGIPHEKIEMVDDAKNSREEIASFAGRRGRLIIVSNAFHLPRLMMLASHTGAVAIAAPAGFKASNDELTLLDFIPNAESLNNASIAVYERMGMAELLLFQTR